MLRKREMDSNTLILRLTSKNVGEEEYEDVGNYIYRVTLYRPRFDPWISFVNIQGARLGLEKDKDKFKLELANKTKVILKIPLLVAPNPYSFTALKSQFMAVIHISH